MRSSSVLTATAAIAFVGFCASAQEGMVTYDLNSPSQLTGNFHTPYTGSQVSQSTTGGLNNSGALNFRSGGGNQAWYSNGSYAPLAVGDTLNASLYFKITANNTSSIKLGFASDPQSAVDAIAMPTTGSWVYFGAWTNFNEGNLDHEVYTNNGEVNSDNTGTVKFTNGNWYEQQISMTKTAAGAFTLSWNVFNSDSAGNLGSSIISGSKAITAPGLDTTLYTYIGLENPTSSASHQFVDNITMTSDAAVVPEPALIGILSSASFGLLVRRRAKKA